MKPRPYQDQAVASIWNYFSSGKGGNPLAAMPPGTGKSVVIALFIKSVLLRFPTQKILVLTHVKELIQQNYNKMHAVWNFAPAGIYSASLNSRDHKQAAIFAGIASVYKKAALFGHVDLVLIDEAHLVSPNSATMYQAFLNDLKAINPNLKVIGLTATPFRLGAGKLTDSNFAKDGTLIPPLFTDMCFDMTTLRDFNRLFKEGYLVRLIPKQPRTYLSAEGVRKSGGEYIESDLQDAVNDDELTLAALEEAIQLGADRKRWLIFATGIEHAERINEMLNGLGISCKCVHSKSEGRDEAIAEFKRGQIRALVNNNVLTTGFDDSGIDMLVIMRPSSSPVLWVQILGRGTRPDYAPGYDLDTIEGRLAAIANSDKPNCLVLDFARNTERLGPINDPVVPEPPGKRDPSVVRTSPSKLCPVCNTYNHAAATHCENVSHCSHEFPKPSLKIETNASTTSLIAEDTGMQLTNVKIKVFNVLFVTYDIHQKTGAPDMVRVTYSVSGYRKRFDTYICIEHGGFAYRKAKEFWAKNCASDMPIPYTSKEFLGRVNELKVPTHLRIWVNKEVNGNTYPEIMSMCYDGTAFGSEEPADFTPHVNVARQPEGPSFGPDDDIPF